jgi:hypothetical protein
MNHPHPSMLEASVCEILLLRQKSGEIRDLKWQHTVTLPYGIKWKVDWSFDQGPDWKRTWAEAKGAEGRDYKMKLKMWMEVGPGILEIWKGSAARPYMVKRVVPEREAA